MGLYKLILSIRTCIKSKELQTFMNDLSFSLYAILVMIQ